MCGKAVGALPLHQYYNSQNRNKYISYALWLIVCVDSQPSFYVYMSEVGLNL